MPRAHRHFLSGQVWHITHRCHKQELQEQETVWVEDSLQADQLPKQPFWSNSVLFGPEDYIIEVKNELGYAACKRNIELKDASFVLKEQVAI